MSDEAQELKKANAILRAVLESTEDMIWAVDVERFGLLAFNSRLRDCVSQVFGHIPRVGDTPEEIGSTAVALRDYYERALREGPFSARFENADKTLVLWLSLSPLTVDGQAFGISVFASDLTAHRRGEDALKGTQERAKCLEAIGTLAGGIAHELNNILGGIGGCLEVALSELPEDSPARPWLDDMNRAADRAATVVGHLLALGRNIPRERQTVELVRVVKEALGVVRATLPTAIIIEERYESSLAVMAAPGQLHQLVMNLCSNALLAMVPDGGVLCVAVRECDASEGSSTRESQLRPGRYVCLTVRDTGCGIAPENLERIFEPFFSTRRLDEGTGLGLSLVHVIVREAGGTIRVESQLGIGTTFRVWLPVCEASTVPEPKHTSL